jgi:serine/threonine protein kinase
MPLQPGDKLGHYEILAAIGAGGMGEVYKARDPRLNRVVAIKRLKGQHTARFEQEAHAIAALNHPNICQIHDIGPDYLVLEYIEGKPLSGPLRLEEALKLAVQIASAMEEAHSKSILHRDLKPANILVTVKGSAKILDFGLAKLTTKSDSDTTKTIDGTVLGTAAYMSPEQAQGKPLDERSDIFSFGAVLYELLSGHYPFKGGSTVEVLSAVLRDEPEPLNAPASVAEVVKRCLAKRAAERFTSMAELRAALDQIAAKAPTQQQLSIAVLPFANMSSDKEQEFFSDGLAEEILNLLAKIPSLKVIARTSSFAFRGKEQDIRKIAEALDVKTILEGSVRRSGSRIRVTAQLINAADGAHLWSERYDRQLTDVFEVQDEIAAAIAGALKLKLAPQPSAAERYKPSLPAYEAYLKGRHHMSKLTPASMAMAKEYYEQAISLDPKYALPCSDFAVYYSALAILGFRAPRQVMPEVQTWAQKALDIDPTLQDAHASLAMKAYSFDYDWTEAEQRSVLALARDPAPAWACCVTTILMIALGRAREAEDRMRRVVEADPLMHMYRVYLAFLLLATGRGGEAERELRNAVELDENYFNGWRGLGTVYAARGEVSEALRCYEKAYSLAPFVPSNAGSFAGLLARIGDQRRAGELLSKLEPPETSGVPMAWALYHLYQGETEKAVDWWEKVINQRDPSAILTPRVGSGEALRTSPRWPELAKRMNLPESAW